MEKRHELLDTIFRSYPIELKRTIIEVMSKYQEATEKHGDFPTCIMTGIAIITEEQGELAQAAVNYKLHRGDYNVIKPEAVDTAVAALRFLVTLSP